MIPPADVQDVLFRVADALRVPVLVLALVALAVLLVELGGFVVELVRRRRRRFTRLASACEQGAEALGKRGDREGARRALGPVASSTAMGKTLDFICRQAGRPGSDDAIAKALADFDFASMRRLERTRILVRLGPALGLMGTLIPLAPALAGLASGDVATLSDNLRVAFSVTVVGLLVGAVAFGISLVRDRLYGQDHSDLEYIAATLIGAAR
jgi:biopolymer transport protein ExbB/TolQ